ncbi:hypothetical protein FNV43_RR07450 [Rhamnella rubrinervis]|uniref:Uncharacterized protein n=1 Tax=Rhamnella rubrinervis TaxID=2594499 RepID=A0A8K0MMZ7_9ROSA|nr:hypothetical protein FNV43_RR07450 [Rhamnella rubrinervis]
MAPLKRLRKASDKSTEATTVTEATATKKRSREVEESSNALQDTPRPTWPRGALLLYTGYPSAKCAEASAKLAKGCPLIIYGIPLDQVCRGIGQIGRGVSSCYIRDTPRPNVPRHRPS